MTTATLTRVRPGNDLTRHRPTSATTPARRRSGTFGALNAEWDLVGHRPLPHAWRAHRVLAEHPTPAAVVEHQGRRNSDHDAVLLALLTLARHGDGLASRTVLQAMMGKLVRLSRTARARGLDDPDATVLAAAWETIATVPLHRSTNLAGRIALDTLHRIPHPRAATGTTSTVVDDTTLELLAPVHHQPHDDREMDPTAEVVQMLIWAHRNRALTTAEVRLLAEKYLSRDPRTTLQDISARTGQPLGTLCSRHHRAIRRLAAAMRDCA